MKMWAKMLGLFMSGLSATAGLTYFLSSYSAPDSSGKTPVTPTVLSDADKFIAQLASMKVLEGNFRLRVASSSVGCNLYGDTFRLLMPSLEDIALEAEGSFVGAGVASLPYRINYSAGSFYASVDVFKWTLDSTLFDAIGDFVEFFGIRSPEFTIPDEIIDVITSAMLGWVNDMTVEKNVGRIDYTLAVPFVKVVMYSDLDYNFTGLELMPYDIGDFSISFNFDVTKFSTVIEEEEPIEEPEDAESYVDMTKGPGLLNLVKSSQGSLTTDQGISFDIEASRLNEQNEAVGEASSASGTIAYDSSFSNVLARLSPDDGDSSYDLQAKAVEEGIDYYAQVKGGEDTSIRLKGNLAPEINIDDSDLSNSVDLSAVISSLTEFLNGGGVGSYVLGALEHLGLDGVLPSIATLISDSTLHYALNWEIFSFLATHPLNGIDISDGHLNFYLNNNLLGIDDGGSFLVHLDWTSDYGLSLSLEEVKIAGYELELSLHNSIVSEFEELTDLENLASTEPDSFLDCDPLTSISDQFLGSIGLDYTLGLKAVLEEQSQTADASLEDYELSIDMSGDIDVKWDEGISFYLGGSLKDSLSKTHSLSAYLSGDSIQAGRALMRYSSDNGLFASSSDEQGNTTYGGLGLTDKVEHLGEMFETLSSRSSGSVKAMTGVLGKISNRIDYFIGLIGEDASKCDYEALFAQEYVRGVTTTSDSIILILSKEFLASQGDIKLTLSLADNGISSFSISDCVLYAEGELDKDGNPGPGSSLELSFSAKVRDYEPENKLVDDGTYLNLEYLDLEQFLGLRDLNFKLSGSFANKDTGKVDSTMSGYIEGDLESGLFYGSMDIASTDSGYNDMPINHNFVFDKPEGDNILFNYTETINGTLRSPMKGFFNASASEGVSELLSSIISAGDDDRFLQYFELFFAGQEPWIMKLFPLLNGIISGQALASDYAEFLDSLFTSSSDGSSIIKNLSFKDGVLSLSVDKNFMSTLDDLEVEVGLRDSTVLKEGVSPSGFTVTYIKLGNISMNGNLGTILMENQSLDGSYEFDPSAHPLSVDSSYFDLTSAPDLLGYLMKTANCDYFRISGDLALNLNIISFIPINWTGIKVDASIWIDENEKVYAYIKITNIPSVAGVNQVATGSDEKTSEIFYDSTQSDVLGGTIYLHNEEPYPYWLFATRYHNRYAKITAGEFAENAMFYLCKFILNFNDLIYGAITDAIDTHAVREEPICYSEILTSWSYDEADESWTIGLNFPDLTNNEDCKSLSITLGSTSHDIIDRLSVTLYVNVSDALEVTLSVDASMSVGSYEEAISSTAYSRFNTYLNGSYGRSMSYTTAPDYVSEELKSSNL